MFETYYFVEPGIIARVVIYSDGKISIAGLDGYTVTAELFARLAWSVLARSNTACKGWVSFVPCADLLTEAEYHERFKYA